ncbi:hypothetical protein JB92DRAFT_1864515 [Gautieria morchelliformis]|nr:hypothetical protein JB92DRAFT_1864515 [Gautieria morchelliformis]
MIGQWDRNMDVLLVFIGLFSAIQTAFIIEFYKRLRPDTASVSASLLADIALSLRCQNNATMCTLSRQTLPSTIGFQPTLAVRWTNLLWFTSLTISLTVLTIALLAKQWAFAYETEGTGPLRVHACMRQFRLNGVTDWHMPAAIDSLPLLR